VRPGIAPLDAYLDLLPRKGLMLVDDAHGAGTVGPGGRGAPALFGIHDSRVLLSVTLAKAFAVSGGAVLGAKCWIDPIRGNAGAYTGSTAQPLGLLAAARAALQLVDRAPGRVRRFQSNQDLFAGLTTGIRSLSSDPRSPVTIALPANPSKGALLEAALEAAGIHAPWIQYPGGPDSGFFRFAVSAAHRPDELRRLASVLRACLGEG
jgi:7-keto-8-aminopelargonate synthetase-like enzyme